MSGTITFAMMRRVAPALFLVPFFSLAGCGGGGGSSTPSVPPGAPPLASPIAMKDGHKDPGTERWWPNGNTADGAVNEDVDGIACEDMDENYHIHMHLSIFYNGKHYAIPMGVGFYKPHYATPEVMAAKDWPDGFVDYSGCAYALHTHDLSGKLHVEAQKPADFTLGQFFQIWGESLTPTKVGGLTAASIKFYIRDGGSLYEFTGDPKTIAFKSQREVTIVIGTPPSSIPTYRWDAP